LAGGEDHRLVRLACAKAFYIVALSVARLPLQFRIRRRGEDVAITIQEKEARCPSHASFAGRGAHLSDGALIKMLPRYPLMTVKVVAAHPFRGGAADAEGVRRHPHSAKTYVPAE